MKLERLLMWLALLALFARLSVSAGTVINQPRFGYSVALPSDWEQILGLRLKITAGESALQRMANLDNATTTASNGRSQRRMGQLSLRFGPSDAKRSYS